jgi:hypothetical protein
MHRRIDRCQLIGNRPAIRSLTIIHRGLARCGGTFSAANAVGKIVLLDRRNGPSWRFWRPDGEGKMS